MDLCSFPYSTHHLTGFSSTRLPDAQVLILRIWRESTWAPLSRCTRPEHLSLHVPIVMFTCHSPFQPHVDRHHRASTAFTADGDIQENHMNIYGHIVFTDKQYFHILSAWVVPVCPFPLGPVSVLASLHCLNLSAPSQLPNADVIHLPPPPLRLPPFLSLALRLTFSTRVEQMEISRTNADLGPSSLRQSYSITPFI